MSETYVVLVYSHAAQRVKIYPRVIIAADATIRGSVTIKTGSVIHPHSKIDASRGPIVIGENCIVEERVQLVSANEGGMNIGDANSFRAGCCVCAAEIGNCNIFEPASRVFASISIPNFCVIGAGCSVGSDTGVPYALSERSVIYGLNSEHRVWNGDGVGQQAALHAKELVYLRDTIPKAHKLRIIRP